jgi:hypothetical protein
VGLIGAAGLPVLAQGDFALKYTDAQGGDPVLAMARRIVQASAEKPAGLKALPTEMSGQAKYFSIPVAGRQVLAVCDASKPPRLYVDAAGTGDLSAAQPVPAGGPENAAMYGPVAITGAAAKGQVPTKLRFQVLGGGQSLLVCPGGYMAGEVKLADQVYRVAAVCNSVDGRYDKTLQLPAAGPGQPEFAILAIDLNQDGRFDPGFPTAGEVLPLVKMIRDKDAYFAVKLAPDGSSIHIEKADPGMGTLDVGTPDVTMVAFSDCGVQRFSGSGGKWKVPAGQYMILQTELARTDAAGTLWTLSGSGSAKRDSIEVRAGETLRMKIGPPLVTKSDALAIGDGQVLIMLAVEGQAGERYSPGPTKGNVRPEPPKVRILDEAGKVLAAGNSGFG